MSPKPWLDLATFLRERYGCRVQKISLDAGMSCPNRDGSKARGGCIYCNEWGSGTGSAHTRNLTQQIAAAKPYLARRYKARKFLGYLQSFSNTYAPLPVLEKRYAEILSDPDVVGLCIGTRPDCVDEAVLDHLAELSRDYLIWMEYGLQSARDETLRAINRGHGVQDFRQAVRMSRERGLLTCAHVILGLPGETSEDMMDTASFLASQKLDAVKLHSLYVVRGTRLHQIYEKGSYRCLKRGEYAALAGEFLSRLPRTMVVQRVTGDPHPAELVAPGWALEKKRNLEAVREYMHQRGLAQGTKAGGAS